MKMVALIPARKNSKRIPGKNMRRLGGVPLIEWTIRAALDSRVFSDVQIWTDDPVLHEVAASCWPTHTYTRPPSEDDEPDINWVRLALNRGGIVAEQFAILRPTSPFRTADTIRRAYTQFQRTPDVHSLRAVEPVQQHPGKMWWCNGPGYPLTPVCDAKRSDGTPWHSSPTQSLPPCYVQNASLEMAWSYVPRQFGTISGTKILPFFTEGLEGLDLNDEADWQRAETALAQHAVSRPALSVAPETAGTAQDGPPDPRRAVPHGSRL
jgi:CMP-N,N'-diacetyllegionaminic acid synthase